MRKRKSILFTLLCIFILAVMSLFSGCSEATVDEVVGNVASIAEQAAKEALEASKQGETATSPAIESAIDENGTYTTKDEVALYIHTYGHLPSNYITKKEAESQGWNNKDGNLWEVLPGKSIGGDHFGNYEGQLPKGHSYKECDIDFDGGYRNGKRIIFSEDGLIFYTEDHYKTFEQLY